MDRIKTINPKKDKLKIRDLSQNIKTRQTLKKETNNLRKVSVFFIAVFLFIGMFIMPVIAEESDEVDPEAAPPERVDGDDDNDGVPDEIEKQYQRDMEVTVESHEARIYSTLGSGDVKDGFELRLTSDDGMKLQMEYSKDSQGTEVDLELVVEFVKLIEFEDSNGNGLYDEGDDVVSSYDLGDAEYDDLVHTTGTTMDNVTEDIITTRTSDGVFEVVLHITGSFAKLESGVISPSEVKIDINVEGYPYEEDNTMLALQNRIESAADTELDEETFNEQEGLAENDESEIEISRDNASAFFSWANIADIDGNPMQIGVSTTVDTEGHTNVYFTYPRGDRISHDPKLGIYYRQAATVTDFTPNLIPYIVGILVGVSVVGLAVYQRVRRNNKI